MKIYVDGVELKSVSTGGKNVRNTNTYAVTVGENLERPGREFTGLIDEVRIYDRALTAPGGRGCERSFQRRIRPVLV